ncbi:MAG: uncharacterized protein KVP18_003254 [Porospora cf. gigantea A]|uniref:uncharacterized protein n=1 Tax=Porospora cf. gigantea A TaxID=2853593 RepID=UPI00355AC0F9|nr:MAG: hypothetical protein KVP18_003254 [Porospora cf. gigantea A]
MAVFVVLISVELCLFAINHKLRRLVLAPTLFIIAIMILGIFGYVVFFVGMPVVSSEYALPGVDTKLLWSPHLWLNMLRSVIQCYALGFMVNLGYLVRPSVNIPRAAM